jgi:hypothetical protein
MGRDSTKDKTGGALDKSGQDAKGLIARTKEEWRRFAASEPGRRFQERHYRRQESEHGWRDPRRLFYVVGGFILAVGSLALVVLPGPQMLTFLERVSKPLHWPLAWPWLTLVGLSAGEADRSASVT